MVNIPTAEIDGETWLILKNINKKIIFRADSIEKNKKRVVEPSNHRMDEAVAEGSVKCRPRNWDISQFKP